MEWRVVHLFELVDWDKHVRHLRKRIDFDEFYQQKKSVLLKTKNDCNQL